MKWIVLSDSGTPGGANVACWRLIEGLCREGVSVTHTNLAGIQPPVSSSSNYTTAMLFGGKTRAVTGGVHALGGKSMATWANLKDTAKRLLQLVETTRPDAINLHNLHASPLALDFLEALPEDIPIIWTLHDMWSFTGRCAYSYDCRKFEDASCNAACPTPEEYPSLKPSHIASAVDRKRRFFGSRRNLTAVCPSKWLAEEARSGMWGNHRVEHIPYGLDLEVFYPVDKAVARSALGISDKGRPVLIASAENLADRRKGAQLLKDALEQWSGEPLVCLFLGRRAVEIHNRLIEAIPLGYIHDVITKRIAYSAADLLVHPALADNLPNVVLEAMACGTPTVAFNVGGLPDMVRPGETGWVVEDIGPGQLAEGMMEAFSDKSVLRGMGMDSRKVAEAEYALSVQASAYRKLSINLRHR